MLARRWPMVNKISPSAPTPRWREHAARVNEAGSLTEPSSGVSRKSLP